MNKIQQRKEETKIQRAIKDELELRGYLVRRVHSGKIKSKHGGWMHLAEAGTADLIIQGYCFTAWLEVKTEAGAQNDDQEQFEAQVVRRGNIYLTARSSMEAVTKVSALGGPA